MEKEKYVLELGKEVAYLKLPAHPKNSIQAGLVKSTLRLLEYIPDYKGPDVYLNFDKDDYLIGIEIIE